MWETYLSKSKLVNSLDKKRNNILDYVNNKASEQYVIAACECISDPLIQQIKREIILLQDYSNESSNT